MVSRSRGEHPRSLVCILMKTLKRLTDRVWISPLRFVGCAVVTSALLLGSCTAEESEPQSAGEVAGPTDSSPSGLLRELIPIQSTSGSAETYRAVEAMAAHLRAAGLPDEDIAVLGPSEESGNLVARLRGSSPVLRPILLMAHIDVVTAVAEAWSYPPFELTEEGGFYYGRGTTDNKAGASILISAFVRYLNEGWVPERDLIIMLTGDEETSSGGVKFLLAEHRDLIDAEFALNTDAGGGALRNGEPASMNVQASEKVYFTLHLTTENAGGHSSQPRTDNAIYELARGLDRIAGYRFPIKLNEVTRTFFQRSAGTQPPAVAADMRAVSGEATDFAAAERLASESALYNALLRTTCVATRLEAGHADNALPREAVATVNCRVLPGESLAEVEETLKGLVMPFSVAITRVNQPTESPPSPLESGRMQIIETLTREIFGEIPVFPTMSTGATDGLYVRNAGIPVYGVSAILAPPDDSRAHGQDERVGIREFERASEFWYELIKRMSGGNG